MKIAISDKFDIGEWRHTVLELYALDGPWPTEGEPSEWIETKLVSYCQGEDKTVIVFTPIGRILWWKIGYWADRVWSAAFNAWATFTPWGRAHMRKIDAWWDSIPVVSDCELPNDTSDSDPSDTSPAGSEGANGTTKGVGK